MSTFTVEGTATSVATLPRVNLLPPEIEEQRRFKRVQAGLGLGVVAALGVVGALWVVASGQVGSAQNDLDAQTARSATLNQQAQQYAEVPVVYAQVESARAQLAQAMGQEIRWSYVLNDLSIVTPSKVWLTSVTVTPNDNTTTATQSPTGTQEYLTPGIASVVFEGKAYKHNDVAAWLVALAKEKGFAQPYFTSSKVEKIGSEDSVTFSSQATITEDALSGRWTDKAGS